MKNIYGKVISDEVLQEYQKFVDTKDCRDLHIDIKLDIAALTVILGEIDKSKDFIVCNSPMWIIRGMLNDENHEGKYTIGVWRAINPIDLGISTEHFIDISAKRAQGYDNSFYNHQAFYLEGLPEAECKALVRKWKGCASKNSNKERVVSLKKYIDVTIYKIGLPKINWRRVNIHVY